VQPTVERLHDAASQGAVGGVGHGRDVRHAVADRDRGEMGGEPVGAVGVLGQVDAGVDGLVRRAHGEHHQ
jgi:hypothetical protein